MPDLLGLAREVTRLERSRPDFLGDAETWNRWTEQLDTARDLLREEVDRIDGVLARAAPIPVPALLGYLVREIWIAWAREQPHPKASWLLPFSALTPPEQDVDIRIGTGIARLVGGENVPTTLDACRSFAHEARSELLGSPHRDPAIHRAERHLRDLATLVDATIGPRVSLLPHRDERRSASPVSEARP